MRWIGDRKASSDSVLGGPERPANCPWPLRRGAADQGSLFQIILARRIATSVSLNGDLVVLQHDPECRLTQRSWTRRSGCWAWGPHWRHSASAQLPNNSLPYLGVAGWLIYLIQ